MSGPALEEKKVQEQFSITAEEQDKTEASALRQETAATEQQAQREQQTSARLNQQIERIQADLGESAPVTRAEASPELRTLKNNKSLSKKEKKQLKEMENQQRRQREQEEALRREQEVALRREQQRLAEEKAEREDREIRDKLLQKMAEEEEGPASIAAFAALHGERDEQKIEATILALTEKLMEVDSASSHTEYKSNAQTIKSYRLIIAEHLRYNPQMAESFSAELTEHMQEFDKIFEQNLRVRVAERELKQLFWAELIELNPNAALIEQVFLRMTEKADLNQTDRINKFFNFRDRLAAATGLSPDYLASRQKSGNAELAELAAKIGEDEAMELLSKRWAKPFQELERLDFEPQDSVVAGLTQEQLLADGGAFRHLTARNEEEARRLVETAGGFLYMERQADGRYALKPTAPEQAVIQQMDGREARIDLRKNYNRLVKLFALKMLDADGKISEFNPGEITEKWNDVMSGGDAVQALRDLFGDLLHSTAILAEDEDENQMLQDMGVIFKEVMNSESINNIENFVLTARAQLKEMDDEAYGDEQTRRRREYLLSCRQSPQRGTPLGFPNETEEAYMERVDKALDRIKTARQEWLDSALPEFQALRDLDVNSRDVFLPGACSANAAVVSRMRGKEQADATAYAIANPAYALQSREYICGRLAECTGRPNGDFQEMTDADLRQAYMPFAGFDYHQAANIGETAEGAQLTLEAFAATSAQFTVAPFTRQIYMGVYRDGEYGFRNYYNRDASGLETPEEHMLAALKQAGLL